MLKTIYFTPTITPKHHGNGHTTLKSTGSRPITTLVRAVDLNGRADYLFPNSECLTTCTNPVFSFCFD
jgi:hypothetical protein